MLALVLCAAVGNDPSPRFEVLAPAPRFEVAQPPRPVLAPFLTGEPVCVGGSCAAPGRVILGAGAARGLAGYNGGGRQPGRLFGRRR